jgi:vitamin K-dependent gamma-carboxylase
LVSSAPFFLRGKEGGFDFLNLLKFRLCLRYFSPFLAFLNFEQLNFVTIHLPLDGGTRYGQGGGENVKYPDFLSLAERISMLEVAEKGELKSALPPKPLLSRWANGRSYLFAPVDSLSLALFRIAFGSIMLVEVWRYFEAGWIYRYYIQPTFFFSYLPFVRPWSGEGMYWHFIGLGVLAFLIAVGLFYRVAAWLFFFGFSYVFLLDKTQYLNHFYLICLISLLMALAPANRSLSLDRWRAKAKPPETVPFWNLGLLRFQIVLVYFYGGIAKLNEDWLRGEPLGSWLREGSDLPILGRLLGQEWTGVTFAIAGLIIDLTVGFLLLWHKTFWVGAGLAIFFNFLNSQLFEIGIFPYFMLATLVLFPRPDWARNFLPFKSLEPEAKPTTPPGRIILGKGLILFFIYGFIFAQLLIPLRHHVYPGDVNWTEEGHRFSWRMKLRDKTADITITTTDPQTRIWRKVNLENYLTPRQIGKMATRPDMVIQFAHYLAAQWEALTGVRPLVNAQVRASLNGRPPQDLIDPQVNLAAEPLNLLPASWIIPLEK